MKGSNTNLYKQSGQSRLEKFASGSDTLAGLNTMSAYFDSSLITRTMDISSNIEVWHWYPNCKCWTTQMIHHQTMWFVAKDYVNSLGSIWICHLRFNTILLGPKWVPRQMIHGWHYLQRIYFTKATGLHGYWLKNCHFHCHRLQIFPPMWQIDHSYGKF